LAEQNESLRRKDVTVLGIQAAAVTSESFDRWKDANPLPFKLGRVTDRKPASTWVTEADSLPWLILVNPQGRVIAEGFSPADLAGKLAGLGN
jgi:hypothetical protein